MASLFCGLVDLLRSKEVVHKKGTSQGVVLNKELPSMIIITHHHHYRRYHHLGLYCLNRKGFLSLLTFFFFFFYGLLSYFAWMSVLVFSWKNNFPSIHPSLSLHLSLSLSLSLSLHLFLSLPFPLAVPFFILFNSFHSFLILFLIFITTMTPVTAFVEGDLSNDLVNLIIPDQVY